MLPRLHLWLTLFVAEAVRGLLRNKVRSALTALGIMIGIAAVVLVVAIGKSGSDRAELQLHNLGDNLVWIEAGSRQVNGVRTGTKGTTSLTLGDAAAVERDIPLIKAVSPQVDGTVQTVHGNQNWSTRYRGVTPDYLGIKRWVVESGTAFTKEDVELASNVCLIGKTVREQLFGAADPVGQQIRVEMQSFVVVGLLGPKGQSATGQDQDDTLMMPYTTAQKKLKGKGYEWLDDILCSATSAADVDAAVAQVVALMRERHHIQPGQDDDFNIRRPEALIRAQLDAAQTLAMFLLCLGAISLLVGGIGIMNVMLATVSQRTREIGLRLAVGAKRVEVQLQFLGEAVILSLFGGLAGISLSLVGADSFADLLEWPIRIPPQAIVLAVAFSIVVGVGFGLYPAWRAARMDPIAALRSE